MSGHEDYTLFSTFMKSVMVRQEIGLLCDLEVYGWDVAQEHFHTQVSGIALAGESIVFLWS